MVGLHGNLFYHSRRDIEADEGKRRSQLQAAQPAEMTFTSPGFAILDGAGLRPLNHLNGLRRSVDHN